MSPLWFLFVGVQVYQVTGEHPPVDFPVPTSFDFRSSSAASDQPNDNLKGNADSFVDKLLSDFSSDANIMALLKPLILPDIEFDLGSVQNVTVSGLPALRRTGGAMINFYGEKLIVDMSLGIDEVLAHARYAVKLGVRLSGRMQVVVEKLNVNIRLAMIGSLLVLERFSVTNIGIKLTDFTGTSALNGVNRWFINRSVKAFGKLVRSRIEKLASATINDVLPTVNLLKIVASSLTNLGKR